MRSRGRWGLAGAASALVVMWASAANADPCEARLPSPGETFSGTVRYIGDGDSLCVEVGGASQGSTWVEVRLADFSAPELSETGGRDARETLRELVMGRRATCRAGRRSYDRVVAHCTVGGTGIGALLRRAGVREGGN